MTGEYDDTNLLEHLLNVLGYTPNATAHDRRVIDVDRVPSAAGIKFGCEDSGGRNADRAAAEYRAWLAGEQW